MTTQVIELPTISDGLAELLSDKPTRRQVSVVHVDPANLTDAQRKAGEAIITRKLDGFKETGGAERWTWATWNMKRVIGIAKSLGYTPEDFDNRILTAYPGDDSWIYSSISGAWRDATPDDPALWALDGGDAEFWDSREALRRIAEAAALNGDSPWAVLGIVLARVAGDIPVGVRLHTRRVVHPRDVPNLYVALPTFSGGGKTDAASVAKLLWPGRVAWAPSTPEFILDELSDEEGDHSLLAEYDELSALERVANRAGNHLFSALCSGWAGTFPNYGSRTSRIAKLPPLQEGGFRLCMFGGIQPAMAEMFFGRTGDALGLTQRMLWFDPTVGVGAGEHDYDHYDTDEPPVYVQSLKPEGFGDGLRGGLIVSFPREAKAEMAKHRHDVKRGHVNRLDTHLAWNQAKVAFLLAVLDGRVGEVTLDDWALAGVVAEHSVRARQRTEEEMIDRARSKAIYSKVASAEIDGEVAEVLHAKYLKDVERLAAWITKGREASPGVTDAELKRKAAGRDKRKGSPLWDDAVERANLG